MTTSYYINSQITDAVTQLRPFWGLNSYTTTGLDSSCNSFTVFDDELQDGYKIIACIPGCAKENVSVTYTPDDNIINLKASSKAEHYNKEYEACYAVPNKYNLDELECVLKNGLLTISVPFKKNSKPKEVKIT